MAEKEKKSSQALKNTRVSMQNIMEHTPLGICVTDRNGYFESVNNAYLKLYGYDESELLGRHFTLVVPDEQKKHLSDMHDRFIVEGTEIRGEWEVVDKKGRSKSVLADAALIYSEEGDPKKVTFVMDISREKEFQRQLEEKNRELEELNAAKDRFLGMAAHDLRSPLAGIKSFSEMMLEGMTGELNEEQQEYMQLISRSSNSLLKLINDLLDINSIARGRLVLETYPSNLRNLINQNIHKQEILARKKEISISGELDNLPEINIDPDRINQVLDNLLSNAIKFSPPGTYIRVQLGRKNGHALIKIEDQGPGISAAEQEKLFSEFHRGAARPTGNECSTGLGLAIAKRIVQAHGGDIHVESTPGQGSEFMVSLPFEKDKT